MRKSSGPRLCQGRECKQIGIKRSDIDVSPHLWLCNSCYFRALGAYFFHWPKQGATICLIDKERRMTDKPEDLDDTKIIEVGVALTSDTDQFNRRLGREIALNRARGAHFAFRMTGLMARMTFTKMLRELEDAAQLGTGPAKFRQLVCHYVIHRDNGTLVKVEQEKT